MYKTNFNKVQEWHKKFGCLQNKKPTWLSYEKMELRLKLIDEEVNEIKEAVAKQDIINLAKELADLLYVTYGFADTLGIDLDAVFRDVHVSNMSKLDENGNPIRRKDGKILKSKLYKEPDLSWLTSD